MFQRLRGRRSTRMKHTSDAAVSVPHNSDILRRGLSTASRVRDAYYASILILYSWEQP